MITVLLVDDNGPIRKSLGALVEQAVWGIYSQLKITRPCSFGRR